MRRLLMISSIVSAFFTLSMGSAQRVQGPPPEPTVQGDGNLKVMTYNVYAGTAFNGATAPNRSDFLAAMTQAVLDARASDPAGRAEAVARKIAATRPHLVSLQEVFTMSTGTSKDDLTLEFDYLQLLLQALAAQGAPYIPVESVTTWDATVPNTLGYVRSTWRIVILVRADLRPEQFSLTNVDGNIFSTTISYPLPALDASADCPVPLSSAACVMPWPRGWASADILYRGKQFRYVNATLESRSNSRNIAQGTELLNGTLKTEQPVILAGDLNCDLNNAADPKRVTCLKLIDAGFVDAWSVARPSEPGFTKELPVMTMRGDYVMIRDLFHAQGAVLIGEDAADMTSSAQWPSNHAGVVAKLDRPD